MKSHPLEGTPGLQIHFGPGREAPQPSQPQGPITVDLEAKQKKPDHTSNADDEHFMKGTVMPPGLPGGDLLMMAGEAERRRKTRRRTEKRVEGDPGSSPTTSSSDSESSFARKVRKTLEHSRSSETKAKESDRVLVPKFPQPETYRNWRIRVGDAVIAASSKPDLAFQWIEEVFRTGQSIEALKDSGKFVTLDAKLMSSFTNLTSLRKSKPSPELQPEDVRHFS